MLLELRAAAAASIDRVRPGNRMKWLRAAPIAAMALIVLAMLTLVMIGCGSDDDSRSATAAAPGSDVAGAIEAVVTYIGSTGLDGERLALTDPVDCAEMQEEQSNEGKVCLLLQESEIAEDAAQIKAQLAGKRVSWTLSLIWQNKSWLVSGVTSGSSKENAASLRWSLQLPACNTGIPEGGAFDV